MWWAVFDSMPADQAFSLRIKSQRYTADSITTFESFPARIVSREVV